MRDIQAYKITDFSSVLQPTFNVVDYEWLVDQLDIRFLDAFGKGIIIAEKSKIKRLIKKAKKEQYEDDQEMYLKVLNKMLEDCGEEEFVFYKCY